MSQQDLELPLGKRKFWYRFWEMVPAILSYSILLLMLVLSFISSFLASLYLLGMILILLIRASIIAVASVQGRQMMVRASKIDWSRRLMELDRPEAALETYRADKITKDLSVHIERLQQIAASPADYPRSTELTQLVIVAAYNEPYEVIEPTMRSLLSMHYNHAQMVIVFAYEERGGQEIAETAERLKHEFSGEFRAFITVQHPKSLKNEVKGKGPNITYAAQSVLPWLAENNIATDKTIVTTLDCDNKPDPYYFDSVSYEFIVHKKRQQMSFQPLALYFGNIWEAPAPMRVIALGNTFWTITSAVRPHILRNFAAHSQPLDALIGMDFWSKRSIVEDGHQYWRSYFFFKGDYEVIPIYLPVYQDAVMVGKFKATAIAQFKQLRRWAYGASDVPYVATRIFTTKRQVPWFHSMARFLRLLDSHISLATIAIIVTVGGWIPLIVGHEAFRDIAAHNLPDMVGTVQRIATIGIFITVILSLKILPPRPSHIHKRRRLSMIVQWVLIPVTSIFYSAFSSLNAQTHLLLGKYLENFDVTKKIAAKK